MTYIELAAGALEDAQIALEGVQRELDLSPRNDVAHPIVRLLKVVTEAEEDLKEFLEMERRRKR